MYDQITLKLNVDPFILGALKEDITSEDVSTNSVMPEACMGKVELICKQDGIICGLQVFKRVFELLDDTTVTELYCKDGDEVKAGQLMGVVTGDIRVLLSGERTALNYLQRMSGIATYTYKVAGFLAGSKIQLLDTRKTTPNNRIFEKYAVRVGGGHNHRYNLSDGVLLKDNHIGAAGGVKEAIRMAKEYAPFVRKIEVEVENLDMVKEAVEAGADIIMLDNMSDEMLKEAIGIIDGIVCPSVVFQQAGGVVALGSDQAPGNNCHNIINEMKNVCLFNKIKYQNPEVMPAWKALRMATIEGAQAIGLGDTVGSLEPGKRADYIAIDLSCPSMLPVYTYPMRNMVPNLVYSARGSEVSLVAVDGKVIMRDGAFTYVDEKEYLNEISKYPDDIGRRAADEFFSIDGTNAHFMREDKL